MRRRALRSSAAPREAGVPSSTGASGAAGPAALAWAHRPPGYPFRGPGWAGRVLPFAVLAVLAEVSLALPPGPGSMPATVVSVVLLVATGVAFALPWQQLPDWPAVLVPLAYTGSVLALILAAGTTSGVAIVALMPIVWTALFHRSWESGVVVAAVVLTVIVFSLVPAPSTGAVIARRVIFWVALGALISVATHGLRQRIHRAQAERAQLQQRLHEVSLVRDRDRIARDLQEQVIQRIFTASLSLQAAGSLAADRELGRRIEGVTMELDEATRLVRQSIFGLRDRSGGSSLRRDVLELCGQFASVLGTTPEVSFTGGIDGAVPGRTADHLVEALRETLTRIGAQPGPVQVAVSATADDARLTVRLPGRWPPAQAGQAGQADRAGHPGQAGHVGQADHADHADQADHAGQADNADQARTLGEVAREIGAILEVRAAAGGGTWLAWQLPAGPAAMS
jgi:signal transduction histidine kinase